MKFYASILVTSFLLGTLSSCSDSDTPATDQSSDNPSGDLPSGVQPAASSITRFGIVGVLDSDTYISGLFYETARPVSAQNLTEQLYEGPLDLTADTCAINTNAPLDEVGAIRITDENGSVGIESISAGETVTITSPAGTFAELQPVSQANVVYFAPDTLTSAVPDNLLLDIPGDAFPAFTNIRIPNIETFALTSHIQDQLISVSEEILWEAGTETSNDTFIRLVADITTTDGMTPDGEYIDKRLRIECRIIDDGGFMFTDSQQTTLTDSGWGEINLQIGRFTQTSIQQDDALLIMVRGSGNS